MFQKKNENQIMLIFLLTLFLIQFYSSNLCFCESVATESISIETEQTSNYKKIILYSLGTIIIIGLCYYFFNPNIDPGVFELPLRDNTALKNICINGFNDCINNHLNNVSDMIITQHHAKILKIPIMKMSNFKLNALGEKISQESFNFLYTLPKDSLLAFTHNEVGYVYQIITIEQFLTLVEKFNIVIN